MAFYWELVLRVLVIMSLYEFLWNVSHMITDIYWDSHHFVNVFGKPWLTRCHTHKRTEITCSSLKVKSFTLHFLTEKKKHLELLLCVINGVHIIYGIKHLDLIPQYIYILHPATIMFTPLLGVCRVFILASVMIRTV